MRLLYWLENQDKQKTEKFKHVINDAEMRFDGIDMIQSDNLLDWFSKYGNDQGTLVITDVSHKSKLWLHLINSLKSGFVLHISDIQYESNSKKNVLIKRASNIDRAIHYFETSLNTDDSQMMNYILHFSKSTDTAPVHEENQLDDHEAAHNNTNMSTSDFTSEPEVKHEVEACNTNDRLDEQVENVKDYFSKNNNAKKTENNNDQKKSSYVVPIKNETQEEEPITNHEATDIDHRPIVQVEEKKEDTNYQKIKRNIQRELFATQKWSGNRTVAVWSPLHRMGVTTFVMNYAFFLAENRIYTTVLEGLTDQPSLKDWLQRYTQVPADWKSFATTIHDKNVKPLSAKWSYRNVMFLPLDVSDMKFSWKEKSLESYMTTPNIVDVTLVDLPTGKMKDYTETSLTYVDELWILVDDTFQEIVAWKDYIKKLSAKLDVPVYLIFNKKFEFSQVKHMEEKLEVELIGEMPSLHGQVMKNYYDTVPLYENEEISSILQDSFEKISQHLFNKKFELKEKVVPVADKPKWIDILVKPLKQGHLFDRLKE